VRPAAPPPPPPPAPPRRRRGRIAAAIAAGVLLVAAVSTSTVLLLTDDDGATEAAAPLSVSGGGTKETRINQIYERVQAGVVSVAVAQGASGEASGTGFVVDSEGTIVTNDHVVEGADAVRVRFEDGGPLVPARVVGTDPSTDIAVVRVDPDRATLRPLTFADSDGVEVGDNAIAIGFPLGLDRTATAGIVSGLDRTIQAPNGYSIDNVIQTDAPINPGNSGGPLLDDRGRVIGVNSQIATAGSRGNVGIGFAVPSNTVRKVVPRLERGQSIRRAYLGVSTVEAPSGEGARVAQITPGSPAERAGLRAGNALTGIGGDVITEVDGKRVRSPDDLSGVIGAKKPGDDVTLTVRRGGREREVEATLTDRPATAPSASGSP
jgi:putative serine protease PepD